MDKNEFKQLESSTKVSDQWEFFKKMMKLSDDKMPDDQKREMRRAFYGGFGQAVMLLRNHIAELPEDAAVVKLEEVVDELQHFWKMEVNNQFPTP